MSRVCICICTMNRLSELRRCLESIERSSIKPYEVIVSDDSSEEFAKKARRIALNFRYVRYVRGPRRGVPANRNNCLKYSTGDFVSFVDDDVIVHPSFIENALRHFREACLEYGTDKIVITGKEIWVNGHESLPLNLDFLGYYKKPIDRGADQQTICMNSDLFPSKLFETLMFDEYMFACHERDISLNALYLGFKIIYCPNLVNFHHLSLQGTFHNQLLDDTSRFYFGLKRYSLYERSILKLLIFIFYAVLRPLAGCVIRFDLREIPTVTVCYIKAWKLFLFSRGRIKS